MSFSLSGSAREKRAKAFAFIFYDFTDSDLQKILKDQGVFARLDRLAGNQNFVNDSTTLTVGPAEGVGLLVIGKQDGAPAVDLYLVLR